eukprot:gene23896-32291_t
MFSSGATEELSEEELLKRGGKLEAMRPVLLHLLTAKSI